MARKDTEDQRQKSREQEGTEEAQPEASEDVQERQEQLTEDVDDILDEIDDVLEENAEDSFEATYKREANREWRGDAASKRCRDCGDENPLKQFLQRMASPDRSALYCKECHNAVGKAARETLRRSPRI